MLLELGRGQVAQAVLRLPDREGTLTLHSDEEGLEKDVDLAGVHGLSAIQAEGLQRGTHLERSRGDDVAAPGGVRGAPDKDHGGGGNAGQVGSRLAWGR